MLAAAGCDTATTRNRDGCTALTLSAQTGHLPAVQRLLKAGAAVNHTDKGGQTALILSAR